MSCESTVSIRYYYWSHFLYLFQFWVIGFCGCSKFPGFYTNFHIIQWLFSREITLNGDPDHSSSNPIVGKSFNQFANYWLRAGYLLWIFLLDRCHAKEVHFGNYQLPIFQNVHWIWFWLHVSHLNLVTFCVAILAYVGRVEYHLNFESKIIALNSNIEFCSIFIKHRLNTKL